MRRDVLAESALLLTAIIWGLNFPVVKSVLEVMPPHVLNALRFVVSALVLGALYVLNVRREGRPLRPQLRGRWIQVGALGLLGFVVYQLSFIIGLDHTTASNAALIMASAPVWTAAAGRTFQTERLGTDSWLGLAVVLIGTSVIIFDGSYDIRFGSDVFFGNLLILITAVVFGVYTALSKPLMESLSPTDLSFLSLLFALPFLFGFGVAYVDETDWERVRAVHWFAIMFSGGLSTGLAVALWNNAIHVVGASNTAVYGNLVPVVAVIVSYLFLGETVNLIQLFGGALVIGGILVMRRASRLVQVGRPVR